MTKNTAEIRIRSIKDQKDILNIKNTIKIANEILFQNRNSELEAKFRNKI